MVLEFATTSAKLKVFDAVWVELLNAKSVIEVPSLTVKSGLACVRVPHTVVSGMHGALRVFLLNSLDLSLALVSAAARLIASSLDEPLKKGGY